MEQKKYKLGLALSGGGAKGFAHCGALKALEEFGLKPDIICGTSAGAIVGALYAAGSDPVDISRMFMGKEFSNFVKMMIPKSGFFDHSPFMDFLNQYLRVETFEKLDIPLYVMASDLDNGKSTVFTSGEIAPCVLASCCLPVIFNPVEINGTNYVDGGIFRNFPVVPIRDICDEVIGINVSPIISEDYKKNMVSIALRAYNYMFRANTFEDKRLCDYLIEVEEARQYSTFDLENIDKIVTIGYDDTVKILENKYNLKRIKEHEPFNLVSDKAKKKKWDIQQIKREIKIRIKTDNKDD